MRSVFVKLASTFRRAARLCLVPLLQGPEEILIGGQAVIEGVMMRSPHAFAVAVRRPSGTIGIIRDSLLRPSEKSVSDLDRLWTGKPDQGDGAFTGRA